MANILKKRAEKHKKKQKGMSPFSSFNDNAGDETINTAIFNNAMGGASGGACESLDTFEAFQTLDNIDNANTIALNETSLSRLLQHTSDKNTFAIIGSQDKDTKKDNYVKLLDEVGKVQKKYEDANIGFNHLKGTYTYEDGTVGEEGSLIIYNIPKEDALRIAQKLNQESIIWKDEDFFGFLTPDGEEDGELGRGMSFDKDAVNAYGSRLASMHNKGKPFVFEASLMETSNRGNNTSKHHKSKIDKYDLFTIKF